MRKIVLIFILLGFLIPKCYALDYTAPTAPPSVSDLVPYQPESFSEGLLQIVKHAIGFALPDVRMAAGLCLRVIAVLLLVSVVKGFCTEIESAVQWISVTAVSVSLLSSTNTLIMLGRETVQEISEYGKLLIPVMTAALASQGGITASGALYIGTAVFNSVLSSFTSFLLIPMIFLFLAFAVAGAATGEAFLVKWKGFIKWLIHWTIKLSLYIFTGYMSITGVVSGTADQTAVKATRLTISGMVPVVGSILSDASDAIVLSAGMVKDAAGIYGLLAIIAIWITPFLQIGIQYLLLKLTASICSCFSLKHVNELLNDFSDAMGLLLAITGACCVFLLISVVCFMKGMG